MATLFKDFENAFAFKNILAFVWNSLSFYPCLLYNLSYHLCHIMLFLHLLTVEPREYSPDGTLVKNSPANAGDPRDMGSIPGSGRSPGVGNGSPLQYSCWENFQRQRSLAIYVSMRLQRVEHDCNDLACTCIIRFSNSIPGYLSEENKNTNSKICMHPNVHCNIISNSEDI